MGLDTNREQLAKYLFCLMNQDRQWASGKDPDHYWEWYQQHGFDTGYLRLADHVITKGYKP